MRKKAAVDKQKSHDRREGPGQAQLERDLEEGLEDTFPASDPVAISEPVVDIVKSNRKK